MEIVTPTPNGNGVSPFHNHDVREWSRIDNITGALERARLETDHWSASTSNAAHKYNKVVDSRARSDADGAVQQSARRQLEVFQSSVPGGLLQVIKTHTVSSSRWSSKVAVTDENKDIAKHFEDLELSLNPLDLSSQKSKASVGRSIGKRPPSRPSGRDPFQTPITSYTSYNRPGNTDNITKNVHRVSRLCHQVHDNAVKRVSTFPPKASIYERQSGDGVEIVEIEKPKPTLSRTKSSSSEDINLLTDSNSKSNKSIEDLEDLEQLQNWRRASKIRRSLQFPKQPKQTTPTRTLDLPKNTGSVRRIREDLETGRRLNTALRGNNVDLEALDQILQSISNSSGSDKNSVTDDKFEEPERDEASPKHRKQKRDSFVTVESLQEVKGRLKPTNSNKPDVYKKSRQAEEDIDDGIVTEESNVNDLKGSDSNSPRQSRVRSYVYGMETMMNKKTMLGTGSLESRSSKQFGGVGASRNEDWYNRRKSYGFEQVHSQQESINSINRTKTIVDSSTDSGICRSSEIVVVPVTKKNVANIDDKLSDLNSNYEKSGDTFLQNVGSVKRYTSIFENKYGATKQFLNDLNRPYDKTLSNNDFSGATTSVPIAVQNNHFNTFTPINITSSITEESYPLKRHSIAVDETKYVKHINDSKFSHTTLVTNDDDDDLFNQNRKSKKVEFCKTEVHFAAESGKVNIVETDEKPPPTNNFRRRRRHSATLQLNGCEKSDLPLLHFGEGSFEVPGNSIYDSPHLLDFPEKDTTVTISTGGHHNYYSDDVEDDQKDDNETPKGILKNKPIKPKPYILGDDNFFTEKCSDYDKEIWGVKLKSVGEKQDPPVWKSTVTLKNTLYEKNVCNNNAQKCNTDECKNPDKQSVIRIIHPPEPQKSASLVSSVVHQTEDLQKMESRGYSTKVNIGHGNATVVKDDSINKKTRSSVWAKPDTNKDIPETLKKENEPAGLRITNGSGSLRQQRRPLTSRITLHSPVVLRKNYDDKNQELKTAFHVEQLSSPSLVGQDRNMYSDQNTTHLKQSTSSSLQRKTHTVTKTSTLQELPCSPSTLRRMRIPNKSPSPPTNTVSSKLLENNVSCPKSPNPSVLRNPRKSEMTYFGVQTSPSPKPVVRPFKPECLNNKPDLLHNTLIKKNFINANESPLYENISDVKVQKQFDSSILDELTKAADQILQAVNEYAEEVNYKENTTNTYGTEKLDTISETKSWKHKSHSTSNYLNNKSLHKAKRTSSTSSLDSATEQKKVLTTSKRMTDDELRKKKNGSETSSSSKAAVKARRLQRASSREALLQSHGSSSEDLPISVPVRKPRLSRKPKSASSSVTNGTETGRTFTTESKKLEDRSKITDRIPVGALPEIRHKTAVSTIRSTAEKSAMRDRLQKSRQEEAKKTTTKRDGSRSGSTLKTDRNRSISNKEPINHRISTASIKKCHKSEVSTR